MTQTNEMMTYYTVKHKLVNDGKEFEYDRIFETKEEAEKFAEKNNKADVEERKGDWINVMSAMDDQEWQDEMCGYIAE